MSVTGSVRHDWSITRSDSCASTGTGTVSASFRARSGRFRLVSRSVGHERQWLLARDSPPARGRASVSESTRQNPPASSEERCAPPDRGGCGERPLSRRAHVTLASETARRPDWKLTASGLLAGFPAGRGGGIACETGGFNDFTRYPAPPDMTSGPLILTAPTARQAARRLRFRTIASDRTTTSTDLESGGTLSTTTVRRAEVILRAVRR